MLALPEFYIIACTYSSISQEPFVLNAGIGLEYLSYLYLILFYLSPIAADLCSQRIHNGTWLGLMLSSPMGKNTSEL